MEDIFVPSDIKLNVNIAPESGATMDDFDFSVEVFTSPVRALTFKKEDTVRVDENNYFVPLHTGDLPPGRITIRTIAFIPDPDMPNGIKRDAKKIETDYNIVY